MTLTYKIGNIFDIPLGWDIVHCVTADFSCGAGIAKELNERCNLKEKFEAQHFSTDIVGSCVKIDNVFNLLTKQNSCLLYTSPSPRDSILSRMPSSA